jgi:SAICAR synthetase
LIAVVPQDILALTPPDALASLLPSYNVASHVARTSPTNIAATRELSLLWFDKLKSIIPDHVVTLRIEEVQEVRKTLIRGTLHSSLESGRSIILEAIMRGYITGEHSIY